MDQIPNIKIEQNVEHNDGLVAGIAKDNVFNVNTDKFKNYINDIEKAIKRIEDLQDISKDYKDTTIELLKMSFSSIEKNSEEDKKNCKNNFSYFVKGAGKAVDKIITILSSFATIATFFGLNVTK